MALTTLGKSLLAGYIEDYNEFSGFHNIQGISSPSERLSTSELFQLSIKFIPKLMSLEVSTVVHIECKKNSTYCTLSM